MADNSSGIDVHGPATRAIREALGIAQADLASEAGISRPYMNQIESGARTSVSPQVFDAISSSLRLKDKRAIMPAPYCRCTAEAAAS